MTRFHIRPLVRLAPLAALVVMLGACTNNGQAVDAGGERGGGGLAFVLLTVFLVAVVGFLFLLDRARTRKERDR